MSNLLRSFERDIRRNDENNINNVANLSPEEIERQKGIGKKILKEMGVEIASAGTESNTEREQSQNQEQEQKQKDINDPEIIAAMMDALFEAKAKKALMDSDKTPESQIGGLSDADVEALSKQYNNDITTMEQAVSAGEEVLPVEEIDNIVEEIAETPATPKKSSFKEILNTPVSEPAREMINKIKKHKNKALGALMAAAAITALTACGSENNFAGSAHQLSTSPNTPNVNLKEGETQDIKEYTGNPELDKLLDGSLEQDDNVGCYEEKDKVTDNSVGKPSKILESLGIDPTTATAEEWGMATQFMEYSMKYPAAANAVVYKIPGFENFELSDAGIQAAEAKIAKMNKEEKVEFLDRLKDLNDGAEYKLVSASGTYKNQAVEDKIDKRESTFSDTVLDGTILIQKSINITNEDGSRKGTIIVYYKEDCGNFLAVYQEVKPDGTIIKYTITLKGDDDPSKPTPDNPNPDKPTPDNPTPESEWGKSGDPHSGPNRLPSDPVDPNSEIPQSKNDAVNRGNQGYVEDNKATPGSPSGNNGTNNNGFSNIPASGSDTDGGRLSGGEPQGGDQMNGTNPNAPTQEQINIDNNGNDAQQEAYNSVNTPGGDNYDDSAEEDAVDRGDF